MHRSFFCDETTPHEQSQFKTFLIQTTANTDFSSEKTHDSTDDFSCEQTTEIYFIISISLSCMTKRLINFVSFAREI